MRPDTGDCVAWRMARHMATISSSRCRPSHRLWVPGTPSPLHRLRGDIGRFPSLAPQAIDTRTLQYRAHPGWTMQLHADNLRATLASSGSPVPSYQTVRRFLMAHGLFRLARPKRATDGALAARDRLDRLEVRSFEVDHVGALWHFDSHISHRGGTSAAARPWHGEPGRATL